MSNCEKLETGTALTTKGKENEKDESLDWWRNSLYVMLRRSTGEQLNIELNRI